MSITENKRTEPEIPKTLPIIPVRNTVFFPNQFIPLAIGRPKSLRIVEAALREDGIIGVVIYPIIIDGIVAS